MHFPPLQLRGDFWLLETYFGRKLKSFGTQEVKITDCWAPELVHCIIHFGTRLGGWMETGIQKVFLKML